jgi:tetratricopeptide (TPR) repeat protein
MSLRKSFLIVILFCLVLVLPFLVISNPWMQLWQDWIDQNPETPTAEWLQIALGDIYYNTFRFEQAAEAYSRFLRRYKDSERYPEIFYYYALSLKRAGRWSDAKKAFQHFLELYPDDPRYSKAEGALQEIRWER